MLKFVRREVLWKKQDVYTYGGDGEYAGSFANPDFVEIQRAVPGDCVVAKQAKTGHWYWFRDDDTQLPWSDLRSDGFCEAHDGEARRCVEASFEGPFATEDGAKRLGEDFARKQLFNADRRREAEERYKHARAALTEVLARSNSLDE